MFDLTNLYVANNNTTVTSFLADKPAYSVELFNYFIEVYGEIGLVDLRSTKTMIAICNTLGSIAWVTQFGKKFVHIVFPFHRPYNDNLCFVKIAQVPGDGKQFNHHFRMMVKDDITEEVKAFMKLAYFQTHSSK